MTSNANVSQQDIVLRGIKVDSALGETSLKIEAIETGNRWVTDAKKLASVKENITWTL